MRAANGWILLTIQDSSGSSPEATRTKKTHQAEITFLACYNSLKTSTKTPDSSPRDIEIKKNTRMNKTLIEDTKSSTVSSKKIPTGPIRATSSLINIQIKARMNTRRIIKNKTQKEVLR